VWTAMHTMQGES